MMYTVCWPGCRFRAFSPKIVQRRQAEISLCRFHTFAADGVTICSSPSNSKPIVPAESHRYFEAIAGFIKPFSFVRENNHVTS